MNLTARERRILKLAEKWAETKGRVGWRYGGLYTTWNRAKGRKACAKELLKLFPKAALKLK